MVRADWRFELAHSYGDDMEAMRIGELSKARGKSLTPLHNRGGSLGFNIPLKNDLAPEIIPIETCIIAVKNDVPVWSGPVWQTKENTDSSRMQVTAVGWQKLLDKRFFRSNMTYSSLAGTDDVQIAMDVLDHANDHDGSLALTRPGKYIDFGEGPEWVWARSVSWIKKGQIFAGPDGAIYRQVPRRQSYLEWQNYLGPAIQQLSDIEDGFDYWVDPWTVEMNFSRKRQTTQSDVIFGYKRSSENLLNAERDRDADKTMNYMRVQTAAGIVLVPAQESIDRLGYFEENANLLDVQIGGTDPEDKLNIGAAYGAEETTLRMWPETVHVIQPKMISLNNKNVPSIFEDYNIGDVCSFLVDEGSFVTTQEQGFRLFGVTIAIDEEGNEKLSNMQIYWGGGGG